MTLAVLVAACCLASRVAAEVPASSKSAEPKGKAATAKPGPPKKKHARSEPLAMQELEVEPLAIVGGFIHPVVGPDVEGGTLVLSGGRIQSILPRGEAPPRGMKQVDARGRHVYPGLVAASAPGLGLSADAWTGGQAAILGRPLADSFNPWSTDVELAAAAGITSAVAWASAGGKGPLAGRAAVLKTSVAEPRGVVLLDPAALVAGPAVLAAAGRRDLLEALERARESDAPKRGAPRDPLRELALGRIPLVVTPDSAGEVLTALEVVEAADVKCVLLHATESWAVADEIAASGASVVHGLRNTFFTPRGDRRASRPGGWAHDAIARLARAGIPTAACPTSDTIRLWGVGGRDLMDLPIEAAFAQRAGLTAEEALAAITIVPARIFGVDRRVGSLEPGKDADVVIADGDLLDYRTFVRTTIVNGRIAWEAGESRHWSAMIGMKDEAARLHPAASSPPAPLR